MKKRADIYLFEKKLANSRTHAQDLIKENRVYYFQNQKKTYITKPSEDLDESLEYFVESINELSFVSRAGNKLYQAIKDLNLDISNQTVLDVGVSTGGFSDCVLQLGAKKVIGVEVGHDQTAKALLQNPKFQLFEGINARQLAQYEQVISSFPEQGFDFMVMDVSFISIKLILPELFKYLKTAGKILTLVKPQFELGPENLNRSGIVKDEKLYPKLEKDMIEFTSTINFQSERYIASKVPGKDGNLEFFMLLSKKE